MKISNKDMTPLLGGEFLGKIYFDISTANSFGLTTFFKQGHTSLENLFREERELSHKKKNFLQFQEDLSLYIEKNGPITLHVVAGFASFDNYPFSPPVLLAPVVIDKDKLQLQNHFRINNKLLDLLVSKDINKDRLIRNQKKILRENSVTHFWELFTEFAVETKPNFNIKPSIIIGSFLDDDYYYAQEANEIIHHNNKNPSYSLFDESNLEIKTINFGSDRVQVLYEQILKSSLNGEKVALISDNKGVINKIKAKLQTEIDANVFNEKVLDCSFWSFFRNASEEIDFKFEVDDSIYQKVHRDDVKKNSSLKSLSSAISMLHSTDNDFGVSAYSVMQHIAKIELNNDSIPPLSNDSTHYYMSSQAAKEISQNLNEIKQILMQAVEIGILDEQSAKSPWYNAMVSSGAIANDALVRIERTINSIKSLKKCLLETDITCVKTLNDVSKLIYLTNNIQEISQLFNEDVWDNLDEKICETYNSEKQLGILEKHKIRKNAKSFLKQRVNLENPLETFSFIFEIKKEWKSLFGDEKIKIDDNLEKISSLFDSINTDVNRLNLILKNAKNFKDILVTDFDESIKYLKLLQEHSSDLSILPDRTYAIKKLTLKCLNDFLEYLFPFHPTSIQAARELEYSYLKTVLDYITHGNRSVKEVFDEAMKCTHVNIAQTLKYPISLWTSNIFIKGNKINTDIKKYSKEDKRYDKIIVDNISSISKRKLTLLLSRANNIIAINLSAHSKHPFVSNQSIFSFLQSKNLQFTPGYIGKNRKIIINRITSSNKNTILDDVIAKHEGKDVCVTTIDNLSDVIPSDVNVFYIDDSSKLEQKSIAKKMLSIFLMLKGEIEFIIPENIINTNNSIDFFISCFRYFDNLTYNFDQNLLNNDNRNYCMQLLERILRKNNIKTVKYASIDNSEYSIPLIVEDTIAIITDENICAEYSIIDLLNLLTYAGYKPLFISSFDAIFFTEEVLDTVKSLLG